MKTTPQWRSKKQETELFTSFFGNKTISGYRTDDDFDKYQFKGGRKNGTIGHHSSVHLEPLTLTKFCVVLFKIHLP